MSHKRHHEDDDVRSKRRHEDEDDDRSKRTREHSSSDSKGDRSGSHSHEPSRQQVEERRKSLLDQQPSAAGAPPAMSAPGSAPVRAPTPSSSAINIAALQASVQARLDALKSKNAAAAAAAAAAAKAKYEAERQPSQRHDHRSSRHREKNAPRPELILTAEGRIVEKGTGEEVKMPQPVAEFKVNLRSKEKVKNVTKLIQPRKNEPKKAPENPYLEPRPMRTDADRAKKPMLFREEGYFQDLGERQRAKLRLEALQQEIAAASKRTGISSATKLALAVPRLESESDVRVPDIEWWDKEVIPGNSYDEVQEALKEVEKLPTVTHLVQHPITFEPPVDPNRSVVIPIMLTKKERKKLRTQRRKEEEKEKQEKIRLGLMDPPAPKVKITNLMRVLGMEAVQDPTKVEAVVKAQMAMRQDKHESENQARKLTKAQRVQKRITKIKKDTKYEVLACVFRINDLSDRPKRFKVDVNTRQLMLTGVGLIHRDISVIIVEGGPRGLKSYKKLMLNRIKWNEEKDSDDDEAKEGEDGADAEKREGPKGNNQCVLVWEGAIAARAFEKFELKTCPSEVFAREILTKHGVPHYWDLALSQSILETAED